MGLPVWAGSAPRVRGTVRHQCERSQRARVSPACAGNRWLALHRISPVSGQPRVCGEQLLRALRSYPRYGSAPRVRGTVIYNELFRDQDRVSPACAGNRLGVMARSCSTPGQPRVCGEQSRRLPQFGRSVGSAPRVRGTATLLCRRCLSVRVSPACAGNSIANFTSAPRASGQPRVCGEQERGIAGEGAEPGSAPRVRGTDQIRPGARPDQRVSPACAGNRPSFTARPWLVKGQPRVCGEQIAA